VAGPPCFGQHVKFIGGVVPQVAPVSHGAVLACGRDHLVRVGEVEGLSVSVSVSVSDLDAGVNELRWNKICRESPLKGTAPDFNQRIIDLSNAFCSCLVFRV
jgi:hypothetical protein